MDGWIADPRNFARQNPSAVVVVYTPENVSDLCLLWNLRAQHGWGSSHPLGVPWLGDVSTTAAAATSIFAAVDATVVGWPVTLTSTSLATEDLEAIAVTLTEGVQRTDVAAPEDLLLPASPPSRRSTTTITFTAGKATIATRTDRDRQELELLSSRQIRPDMRLSIRRPGHFLPSTHSLGSSSYHSMTYVGGKLVLDASSDTLLDFRWPAGFTVLRAVAADHGVTATPSASGRAAMALLGSVGNLFDVAWLAHRPLLQLLYSKAASSGMTWWKERASELAKVAAQSAADSDAVLEKMLVAIEDVSVSHDGESAKTLTFSELQQVIGHKEAASRWLAWAERRALLIRGAEVKCPRCKHRDWRLLSDIAPPIMCPGCGRANERPFGHTSLNFTFRLGEPLRRALESDSIHHLLAMRAIALLTGSGSDDLVGVHPGVDFTKNGQRAEADVVAVLASGAVIVAETKARSTALRDHDLSQLDLLAHWFGATTVLLTSGDDDASLSEAFRAAARTDQLPWRRLLTADDILERFPLVTFDSRMPGPDVCQDEDHGPRERSAFDHDNEFVTGILASREMSAAALEDTPDPMAAKLT